jgi:hypothetical protein
MTDSVPWSYLVKAKSKQTVLIHLKAQNTQITHQSLHEITNQELTQTTEYHCPSQLEKMDQCSKQSAI